MKKTHNRVLSAKGWRLSSFVTTLEERAALIVAGLSDELGDFSEASTQIVRLTRELMACDAVVLYRAAPQTGTLAPLGEPALSASPANERTAKILSAARAAAEDVATNANGSGHVADSLPVRRTVASDGTVTWVAAIFGPDRPFSEPNVAVPRDSHVGTLEPRRDLLGVWCSVQSCVSPSLPHHAPSEGHVRDCFGRLKPFYQVLLRQLSWREAAEAARAQTEKRLREVATIYEIGKAIDGGPPHRLLDFLTEKAAAVMDAQACSLMIRDERNDQLTIVASHGLPDEIVENTRILIGQGVAGLVAQSGQPMMIHHDARQDPRFKDQPGIGLPGIASSITVPLKDEDDRVKGVLCIRRKTPAVKFTMEDQRLFTVFASQASLALRNSRLYGQLRSRVQELSTLSSLTEVISSTLDLDFILNQVADNLVGVVGYDRCLLYLRESLGDGRADKFVPKITRGVDVSILTSGEDGAPPDDTQELIATIAHMMVPVLVEEQDYSLPMARKYCRAMGLLSFHAQPISVRGRAIGVLVVTTDITRRPLALSNLDLLATFIQHAGIAIENARLYAQMERQVRELNALYNMTKTLTTTYGVSRACSTVNKVAAELTRSDACLLLLFNDRLDTLRVRSMFGLPADLSEYVRLLPDTAQVGREARFLREPLAVSLYRHPEQESLFGVQWAPMLSALQSRYSHLLLVPLVTDEANVGYLVLGTNSGSGYHVDESKLVSILASNAAAVLRNAAIYEQSMEQRVLELSALYEVSKQVRSARSFTSALDSILDIVASIVLCDEAIIYTVDNETGHLHVRAARGEESEKQIGADVPTAGSGIAAWVVLEQKALLSADITSDERFAPTSGSTQMRSLMAIPVFLADEALAVLIVQSAIPNLYSEDNVKMISLIAAQAAALFREMESVRELTSYTENVLRSIAAGVVTLDPAGRIVTFNSAAERILRLSGSDVLGQRLDQIVGLLHADEKDCADTLKMVTLAVEARQTVHRHRLRYHVVSERDDEATLDQENESVVVNASASILSNERDEYLGVVLVFEDITKEEEMEQELTRMGRLAEIGQLAAGIAHELRNPLASIKGAAQVVLSELPADIVDRHREFLDIIVSEVNALKDVTSEFLEFSRPTPPDMTLLDLNSLLSRRLAFLGPEFERGDIAVRQIYDPALPQIEADAGQIDRVVTNLVLNAVQAMPEGGIFTVATICAPGGRNDIVEVCLSDTGIGMTEETLGRLFTPFYTTKTKGTGLGLAIAQKIVDAHGGRIHVRSTPGAGAAFTLILPVVSPMSGPFVLESDDSADISAQRLHTPYKHRQPPDDVDYNKDGIGWENPVTSL